MQSTCHDVPEVDGAGAEAAVPCSFIDSEVPSSSSCCSSTPVCADVPPSSPKVVVEEADPASQVSGSGCTSQASVDDEDDVPITDIYLPPEDKTWVYSPLHYTGSESDVVPDGDWEKET
ncbi:hypothetical protein WMY93_024788 [Mugilogobius chulae]|uniref:Uncharacterized protein n=1 Tax=Mugilogobius chulae TaxID=88201 RepID=A0AAW0N3X3_9GOBI